MSVQSPMDAKTTPQHADVDIDLCGDEPQIRPLRKRDRDDFELKPNCKPDGTPIHPEGAQYIGMVDRDGYYTGVGEMTYPDNSTFVGEFLHGYYHGNGTLVYATGGQYTGAFVNGMRHGKGIAKYSKAGEYSGEFANNHPHGEGTLITPDGNKYTGSFVFGKMHGKIRTVYPNGSILERKYVNGSQEAFAEITYADGYKYKGPWPKPANIPYTVEIIDANGVTYKGDCLNGKRHGVGTLSIPDSYTYTGTFRNGLIVAPEGSPIKKLQLGK